MQNYRFAHFPLRLLLQYLNTLIGLDFGSKTNYFHQFPDCLTLQYFLEDGTLVLKQLIPPICPIAFDLPYCFTPS
jgi:hypothetical protein